MTIKIKIKIKRITVNNFTKAIPKVIIDLVPLNKIIRITTKVSQAVRSASPTFSRKTRG